MIFEAPLILLALAVLPVLWWLLRATPPAPRAQNFPAIRLLAALRPKEETPARTPWWLLLLRVMAAALIITGLARPLLNAGHVTVAGHGPALLVIDDGFSAGPDFARRLDTAAAVLDRLERAGRAVSLLTTAPGLDGQKPAATSAQPAALLRPAVQALRPMPWPTDREAAAHAVTGSGPVFYISDGLATPGDAAFARALRERGQVTEFVGDLPSRLLTATATPDRLTAALRQTPSPTARLENVLAEANDGRVFARIALPVPAGASHAEIDLPLPPELRNQLGALRLSGVPGAGAVALLDEAARRRPVGLVAAGGSGGETPLLGDLFYLDRALAPTTELRRGDIKTLLTRQLSMLVIAGGTISPEDSERVQAFVKHGGLLLRFAGPALAPQESAEPDPLLPEKLLAGDRQLGGAMSWSQPAHLAPFPDDGPFSGLQIPGEVTVNREVLADPADPGAAHVWARLTDGTPLVTAARLGAGEVVLFHVTANADWSNLPLSGLFLDMLNRLVQRSVGVAAADDARMLSPALALDGAGVLGAPPPAARAISVRDLADTLPSPQHPPGFYGPERDRHAFNLGAGKIALAAMAPVAGATRLSLDSAPREQRLGPWLIAAALLLLCADMVVTLRLRGLLDRLASPVAATMALLMVLAGAARAESPALATHLAYVVTGDVMVDAVSRSGLAGLSDYVNSRTAAVLADPAAVVPGRDDLSFYPLIYYPVTSDAAASPEAVAALNNYMHHGGIVVFDLRGGDATEPGSGAGFAPDTGGALRRIGKGLDVPRLAPLTSQHVLAHAFYLLSDFPGRFDGDTVWVQQDQDRSNDSVSPVIVGSNDWAAAWAQDEDGRPQYAVIPGGQRQRTLAFRFGVNLVMYALTGNYKGDQVHVPAILERLGQ